MTRRMILAVGHSHLRALHDASTGDWPGRDGFEIVFAPLDGPAFQPPVRAGRLHPSLASLLRARRLVGIACLLRGNRDKQVAIVNHPVPYDVLPPGAVDAVPTPGARVVPYGAMRALMARRSAELARFLAALHRDTALPVFVVEPPPPIPDPEHMARHPGGFGEKFTEAGIAPARLRQTVWRAQAEALAAIAATAGATYLPAPPGMVDTDGMLRPEAWPEDPAHGNARYGAAVVGQLIDRLRDAPMQGRPATSRHAAPASEGTAP